MTKRRTTPIVHHNAETGKSKRPDHPDFWDTAECKANKLTGIRRNVMVMQWEFWILGNCERTVSFAVAQADKNALTKVHVELFCLEPSADLFKR